MLVAVRRAQALLLLLLLGKPVLGWVALAHAASTAAPARAEPASATPEDVSVAALELSSASPSPTAPPLPTPAAGFLTVDGGEKCDVCAVWQARDPRCWGGCSRVPRTSGGLKGGAAIDLLRLLNLSAGTPGVAQVPGPILNLPAFKLRPGFRLVQVPDPGAVAAALASPTGFTLVFVYRQHRKSLGTLLSVHPPGRVTPWFQLASNLRTGHLVLHYRLTTDAKLHQNAWPLRPPAPAPAPHPPRGNAIGDADRGRKGGGFGWTYVSLSLNTTTNRLRLQLDCQPPREQPIAGGGGGGGGGDEGGGEAGAHPRLDIPEDALVYFRQEPGFKKKFLGSMQVAKVYPYATMEHSDWTCKGNQIVRQWQ